MVDGSNPYFDDGLTSLDLTLDGFEMIGKKVTIKGGAELLKEVYRILKPGGLISVYPEHIEIERLKQKIEKSGFYLQNRFWKKIIHEGRAEPGQILIFRKEG